MRIFDRFRGNHTCHGPRDGRLCSWTLAEQLGIGSALPPYSEEQRTTFLNRFTEPPVRRSGVRPTPWLSIGRRLIDPPWPLPSWAWADVPARALGAAFFYANDYVDLSLFHQFFSHPLVVGGTYIEIGGSNGVHASNTLFFEQHLNWTGILIEPTPCGRCVLPYTRPRDWTVNAAVCRKPANLSSTYMAAAFCQPPQDSCVARAPGGYEAYSVLCVPMAQLLPRRLRHVDLFSIDVEDRVMDVLHTFPWTRISVDVVLAECRGPRLHRLCTQRLSELGFHVYPTLSFGHDVLAVRQACMAKGAATL